MTSASDSSLRAAAQAVVEIYRDPQRARNGRRLPRAIDDLQAALASPEADLDWDDTPFGHEEAQKQIEMCVREIEILCDACGYDRNEWLAELPDSSDFEAAPAPTPAGYANAEDEELCKYLETVELTVAYVRPSDGSTGLRGEPNKKTLAAAARIRELRAELARMVAENERLTSLKDWAGDEMNKAGFECDRLRASLQRHREAIDAWEMAADPPGTKARWDEARRLTELAKAGASDPVNR